MLQLVQKDKTEIPGIKENVQILRDYNRGKQQPVRDGAGQAAGCVQGNPAPYFQLFSAGKKKVVQFRFRFGRDRISGFADAVNPVNLQEII